MYQQLNVELQGLDVHVGSLSPGLVDTKGVREHVRLARARGLPHVAFFDKALSADPPMVTPAELLAECAMAVVLVPGQRSTINTQCHDTVKYGKIWEMEGRFCRHRDCVATGIERAEV